MSEEDDGIEVNEKEIIGITKTTILEKKKDQKSTNEKIALFNKYRRIVFLPLGKHQFFKGVNSAGYGLQSIIEKRVYEGFEEWGLSHPKELANFILETVDDRNQNNLNKCGIKVSGGQPIYRVKINNNIKFIKVILSLRGAIIDVYPTNKGKEYFQNFAPETAFEYKIRGM